MENRYYEIVAGKKRAIAEQIQAYFKSRPDILFAYLHGSFFSGDRFRDIDIAVYLKPPFSGKTKHNVRSLATFKKPPTKSMVVYRNFSYI
jgi:predicted nucleotidyltransferase